jgi:hypothetical protein
MPDIPTVTGPASGGDRLQGLRQNSQSLMGLSTPRKIRIDLLLGAVGILMVIAFLFVLLGAQSPEMTTAPTIPTEQSGSSDLMKEGDALIAVSLEEGAFPPDIAAGDQVRIIVTSNMDGTDTARAVAAETIVQSIRETSAVGGRFVITVSGTESVAEEVAASGPVHLAIIKRVQ